jgi:hypothetical protein
VSDALEDLSTEQLREQAFDKARKAHDLRFFWDLLKHLRAAHSLAGEDGSSGAITGSIAELYDLGRELMGRDLGDDEPLVRARFLEYLRT